MKVTLTPAEVSILKVIGAELGEKAPASEKALRKILAVVINAAAESLANRKLGKAEAQRIAREEHAAHLARRRPKN